MEFFNILDTVGALHDTAKYLLTGNKGGREKHPLTTEEKDNKILYDIIKKYGHRADKISYNVNRFVNGEWGTHAWSPLLAKFQKVYQQASADEKKEIHTEIGKGSNGLQNRVWGSSHQQQSNRKITHRPAHTRHNSSRKSLSTAETRTHSHRGKGKPKRTRNKYSTQPASSLRF